MKRKIILFTLLALIISTCSVFAAPKPVIRADNTYFDPDTGLYHLKGNCYLEIRNRIITCSEARVSVGSLEVWGFGGIRLTQGDISFSSDSAYVYGLQDRAQVAGGVVFSRTGLTIKSDNAEYNWRSKIAVFQGNVRINQNGNEWTADNLTYNVDTNNIL